MYKKNFAVFAVWCGENKERLKGMSFAEFQELVKKEFPNDKFSLPSMYKYARLIGIKTRDKKTKGSSKLVANADMILARLDSLEKSMAQALELLKKMPQVKQVAQETVDEFWNRPVPNPFLPKVSWQNDVYNSVNPFESQAESAK